MAGSNGSNAQVLARVHSFTNGNVYEIRKGRDGVTYCTCPAWRFGRGKPCKHLREYEMACKGRPVEHIEVAQPALVGAA